MKKSMILLAAAMSAGVVYGTEYQTVRITDLEGAKAKYASDCAAAEKKKKGSSRWVKSDLVFPAAVERDWKNPKPKEGEDCGFKQNDGRRRLPRLRLPVAIKTNGKYFFWIKHWQGENKRTGLEFLLRNPDGECVSYQLPDRHFDLWENTHAEGRAFRPERAKGWVWTKVEVDIEYPGDYQVWLSNMKEYVQRGLDAPVSVFAVQEVWVTNDPDADPAKGALVQKDIPECYAIPAGFKRATYHDPQVVGFNTSIADPQKRPSFQLMECYSWFTDSARYLKYGITDGFCTTDHIGKERIAKNEEMPWKDMWGDEFYGGIPFGGSVRLNADASKAVSDELAKKYPFNPKKPVGPGNEPIGRAQWQDGSWGGFSDCFPEFNELFFEKNKEIVRKLMENKPLYDNAFCWWTAWEQCGSYDYGPTAQAEYRKFLLKKYGSLEKLNAAWRTEYKSIEDVKPGYWKYVYGKERLTDEGEWHRNAANFIDFRDFCSKAYATRIAQKTRAVREYDKTKHVSSNLSANNISSVMWMQWRPLVFEDTAQITMAGSDMIGYDNYGTDDLYGATYEIFDCFGDGKLLPMVREGAIHAASPELQARSQWHNIAKGMKGQACFCVQEANVGELSKFGMSDMFHGATPRPKIAAFSDNYRALEHLEYVAMDAKRTRAVKPIAIYYSSISHLMNEQPYASIFDCGPDNFFRVYELFHANGYDVTFVTDRQILEGGDWFKSLGAILLIDAPYIPREVQAKLKAWVSEGGALFADAQSGSCDDHTYPTPEFTEYLGIQPKQQQKVDAMAAEKLAFGYSAYSFDVIQRDKLYKTSCEVKDAPGGTHPISRMLDKTMFSAMGYNEVKCIKGTQVMQENNGRPYMVVRNEGKGTVCYFAGYLGTAYGAGCTRYEWTDTHSDDSPFRVVDAWAKWAGLKKIAVNDLPDNLRYGLRFESPLVDEQGNAMMGIVSQLRGAVPSFRVKYLMPANFKTPKLVLGSVNGSRKLEKLPFAFDEKTRELSVRMRGFRCFGNILAFNEEKPFVSVEAVDPVRDAYSLTWFKPGAEVEYKVKVYNPSSKTLKPGKVELRLSDGWFYDRETAAVGEIPAYGESAEFLFKVKAPAYNSCRKLEPINFIFKGADVVSSPAVEMVWFQQEPQNAPAETFGVE